LIQKEIDAESVMNHLRPQQRREKRIEAVKNEEYEYQRRGFLAAKPDIVW
jgi:hypothetical protein